MRVLIVAAYASVRAGLHAMLAEADGCEVAGEVGGSEELERVIGEVRPDAVLFDYGPSDAHSVISVAASAGTALVVLSDEPDGWREIAAAGLPGWGYLSKEADGSEIAAAVRAAAGGLVVLDQPSANNLTVTPPKRNTEGRDGSIDILTAREREVLQLMADGLPNKTIAFRLGISQHTAKFHVASILAKLGAESRTEAVTLGARRGFLIL